MTSSPRIPAPMRPPSQVYYNQDAQSHSLRSLDSADRPPSYPGGSNNSARSQRSNYYINEDNYYVSTHNADNTDINEDYLPEGTCNIASLKDESANLFGLCLFDSDSSLMLINDRAIPITIKLHLGDPQQFTTTQGSYLCRKYFMAKNNNFPRIL